jgi:DNA-binding transcriptional LysR family regulator
MYPEVVCNLLVRIGPRRIHRQNGALGVSVLPKRMVADAAARQLINVRPIGEDGFSFTWYAGLSRDSDKPYLAGFIDLLKSEILGGQGSADT